MSLTVIIDYKSFVAFGVCISLIIAAVKADKESASRVLSRLTVL